jgi:hypothetical protein
MKKSGVYIKEGIFLGILQVPPPGMEVLSGRYQIEKPSWKIFPKGF